MIKILLILDMNTCYEWKLLHSNVSASYNIDTTYVITMTQSKKRHASIANELRKGFPSKDIKILINKGYKNCAKQNIHNSSSDLCHAYKQIFQDAINEKYKNILILEDDFIFSKSFYIAKNINACNSSINKNENSKLVMYLGAIPFLTIPYNTALSYNLYSGGSHAVIYNKNAIKYIYQNLDPANDDFDGFLMNRKQLLNLKKLLYNTPLVYQLFPETENMNVWTSYAGGSILKYGIKLLKLNKEAEFGYDVMYKVNTFLHIVQFVLILLVLKNIVYN
jgi:hypothetical protein